MKRFSISVSDKQAALLTEISELDEVSVSHVVRECLRGTLPAIAELSRFLANPSTRPQDAMNLANDMEALMGRITSGARVVPDDEAPRPRHYPKLPPSSNTGAKYPKMYPDA